MVELWRKVLQKPKPRLCFALALWSVLVVSALLAPAALAAPEWFREAQL